MEQTRTVRLPRVAPWMLSALGAALAACSDQAFISHPAESSNSTEIGSATGTGAAGGSGMIDPGAGGCGAAGGAGDGMGGSIAADDPCASLTAPGAPHERVVWVTGDDQSLNVSTEVSLLWSFQYAVRFPQGERHDYSLVHERCATPAGGRISCSSGELALSSAECSVRYAPKFGVDPGQYAEGKNIYEFKLRLMQGCRVASADAFTIELTYTP